MSFMPGTGLLDVLVAAAILIGASLCFIGSLGLARLRDFYTRLHGPTKASTLGVGMILIGSMLYSATHLDNFSFHEILITLFLFFTAPIAAHMMVKAAMHLQVKADPPTRGQPWERHNPAGKPFDTNKRSDTN